MHYAMEKKTCAFCIVDDLCCRFYGDPVRPGWWCGISVLCIICLSCPMPITRQVGYAMTTYNELTKQPVIGFDMGGTSTDVSRFAGNYEHVFDTEIAGTP